MCGINRGLGNRIIACTHRLRALNRAGDMNKVATLHSSFKCQTLVRTNNWASHAFYFGVVHRSCVESVGEVDTYCETKYLACVPQCLCESCQWMPG